MLLPITSFLRHVAFSMSRNPDDLIRVLKIFVKFLENEDNFKDSSNISIEHDLKKETLSVPLNLSPSAKEKLKTALSQYPSVFSAGKFHNELNLIYAIGQFLTIISMNLDSLLVVLEQKHKDIDRAPYIDASQTFNKIWGKEPQATSAGYLSKRYNQWPKNRAIEDLLEKLTTSINFLKGPFMKLYDKIRDIPE